MKLNRILLFSCNIKKLQASYYLQNSTRYSLNKIYFRNFSLGSTLFNNFPESRKLIFTGVEHIKSLKSVSRKGIQLSKVEEKDIPIVELLKKRNDLYPFKSPEEKLKTVLVEDGKIGFRKVVKFISRVEIGPLEHKYFHRNTDVLIIGGGPTGILIAYALRSQFPHGPKVTVVDKFDGFPRPTTNLGQGIVTQQLFEEEEEIPLLKYGAEFFSSFRRTTRIDEKEDFKLPYEPMGSLILAGVSNADQILKNNEILKGYGIRSQILSRTVLEQKFPWLNLDDVLFGSLGMINEGRIDPWAFLYGIKCKAVNLGVHFVNAEVIDFGNDDEDVLRVVCKLPDGTYNSIDYSYCVVAGGIESLNLINLFNKSNLFSFGLNLPLEERMRYEYCFYAPNGPGINTPIIIESNGTYFRREGLTGYYVSGVPSVLENDGENSPYHMFETAVKPFLMKRVPQLNKLKLVQGWVDVFDYCLSNKIGITGPHPDTNRIVFALGFSHFGLLLLPALARAVMEFIYYDEYQTLDFTPFHIENLWRKQHLEADRKRRELLESEKRIPLNDPLTEKKRLEAN